VADLILTASPAFGGYDQKHGDIHLRVITGLAVVSLALPLGGDEQAVGDAFSLNLPAVGKTAVTRDGATRLARLGRDQLFALFAHDAPDAEAVIADKLQGHAYTTDQTDVWVGLEISGDQSRAVLERICPIDLHADAFQINDIARAATEHLGTLILRSGPDTFVLLSASSSARSFLHVHSVLPDELRFVQTSASQRWIE